MTSSPDPAGRIRRLTRAIGDHHAADIDPFDQLVAVLTYLDDQSALRLLYASTSRSAGEYVQFPVAFDPSHAPSSG